jgi:hypothetical protein
MLRRITATVIWVGRATVFAVGLVTILALALGTTATALAGTGIGATFNLGRVNTVNAISKLAGSVAGGSLVIDNDQAAEPATALDLRVEPGRPPMRVSSSVKVANLNADAIDGLDGSDVAGPQGYAAVLINGGIDPAHPSKGVVGVTTVMNSGVYCFNLNFTPKVAVASAHVNNSALVSVTTAPNAAVEAECNAPFADAVAKTHASQTGDPAPVNFMIVFA